jgi:phenylpyruvate tautomerase PptA (4-oxalocrotonate tautomerase family)
MPLWNVYCTEGTYTSKEKQAFAEAITDIYASDAAGVTEMRMPRFYVVVAFHDLPPDSLFVGGVPRNDFVRFSVDHIAYATPAELRELQLKFINKSIHPFVRDRGLDWEIHIDDTPRDQWTIQGMPPPEAGSEEERRWMRENRPSKAAPNEASTR